VLPFFGFLLAHGVRTPDSLTIHIRLRFETKILDRRTVFEISENKFNKNYKNKGLLEKQQAI
jgi:hypothetical protein